MAGLLARATFVAGCILVGRSDFASVLYSWE